MEHPRIPLFGGPSAQPDETPARGAFDGARYQQRFDELAAGGTEVHGEAAFVAALSPRWVLDVGCGTGRVAIELARRGIRVVGVDLSASMLAVARERGPQLDWVEADATRLELGRHFDVVLMAGNVPLFVSPGTEASLVARGAAHLGDGGRLVAGFQLGRGYELADYDAHCTDAGLVLLERYSTWEKDPFESGAGDYAVSVHGKAGREIAGATRARP